MAVQKANYAVRMYEKVGFRTVDENDEEFQDNVLSFIGDDKH